MHRNIFKASLAALSIAAFSGGSAQAEVIDFEELINAATTQQGQTYTTPSGHFQLSAYDSVDAFTVFDSTGTASSTFSGSTSFYNISISGETVLRQVGGAAFNLSSIDLAELNLGNGSTYSVNFNGLVHGGGTVTHTFVLDGAEYGAETFDFTPFGFSNVDSVSWIQGPFPGGYHQFDNIVVSPVPEPGSICLLGVAGLIVLRCRSRRNVK